MFKEDPQTGQPVDAFVVKTINTLAKRLGLIRKHELAKDKSIFALTRIIIDIDQPYETAEQTVLSVFQKLGIVRGFVLGKSKSGNLRGIIYLLSTLKELPEATSYRTTYRKP